MKRSVEATSSMASTMDMWLHANSAPPFSGMLSRPSMRMRYRVLVASQKSSRSSESGSSTTT